MAADPRDCSMRGMYSCACFASCDWLRAVVITYEVVVSSGGNAIHNLLHLYSTIW